MKKSKITVAAIAMVASFAFTGCGPLSNLFSIRDNPFSKMDIAGATNLCIGKSTSKGRAADDMDKIYKILEDGGIEEVKYYNHNGKEVKIKKNAPDIIAPVGDDFLFIGYGQEYDQYLNSYLVNKKTGAAYDMNTDFGSVGRFIGTEAFAQEPVVKTDGKGYAYYIAVSREEADTSPIVKVDLSGIENLKVTNATPKNFRCTSFEVSSSGALMYTNQNNSYGKQARTSANGIKNIPRDCFYFTNREGDLYYISSYTLYKFVDDFDEDDEKLGECSEPLYISTSTSFKLTFDKKVIILSQNGDITEIYNEALTPRKITLDGLSFKQIDVTGATENYLYVAGVDSTLKNRFVRISLADNSWTNVVEPASYEVTSFTADEKTGYTIGANRMADGVKVIFTIDFDATENSIKILDESSGIEVAQMQRVN